MQVVMVPAAGPDDHAIIPRVQTRQASLPMPRLPYVPLDIAEPKEVVAAVRARRGGTLLNLDRILLHSPPVAMELRNEWGLRPARQGGAPSQRSQYAAPDVPWWQRTFPGFGDPSRGGGQEQAPQEQATQEPAQ